MDLHGRDPSIQREPHLGSASCQPDPTAEKADQTLASEVTADDVIEHSVWDEPALSAELAGSGERLTYSDWLRHRIRSTSAARSWWVTFLVVLTVGPLGVLGALIRAVTQAGWGIVMVAVVGPTTEEIMKIGLLLWIVEKKPYLFRSSLQIAGCALAGGLAFAGIENLMYLYVTVPDATDRLVAWRWTVCTSVHALCSTLAGIGLVVVWSDTVRHHTRPQIARAAAPIVTAIVIHGVYNSLTIVAEQTGWLNLGTNP